MAHPQPDVYLSVLKASYDYEPQSEDELPIKENQLLLLLERVDQDWWKVKLKSDSQESDSPAGLVPAAYVEQAEHTGLVKVLYDYEAASSGELTVKEGDVLYVFDADEDWLLVQYQGQDMAGYVPGNYVEPVEDESNSQSNVSRIVVPDTPSRPVSTYVDPEERVASTKVTADDIRTWSVAEIDKKGKKKKGTLGVGNGAVFFASEADKNPVQKWQTSHITDISSEKAKHIRIEIAGPSPTTLQFHVGSKEHTDEILEKLKSSRSLHFNSLTTEPTSSTPHSTPSPLSSSPKKASVHFSSASPVIIPPREESDDSDDGEEKYNSGTSDGKSAVALYDFSAAGEDELSVTEGEKLIVLEKDSVEWWKCRNVSGAEGVVPASYLELSVSSSSSQISSKPSPLPDEDDLAAEKEAERLRIKERRHKEELELAERARKKAEAERRAKDAAEAAEAERNRRKAAAAAAQRTASPPASRPTNSPSKSNSPRPSVENSRPSPDKTRIWHDRSGQFRVEAAFLGFSNGKVRLHKVNGVIVEVPSEKMSVEDMNFIEKMKKKRASSAPSRRISDDDVPLAIVHPGASVPSPKVDTPHVKRTPKIDWFDFFLSAGCDLDDCTRYATSFERDKIDESILPDITESTMRSLGLREGDIIRVRKAIEKRKPNDNLQKPSAHAEDQIRRDKELAEKLQAQEIGGAAASPNTSKTATPPNLFAGPGGVLKNPRRGRPQPSKSLPPSNVDLKAIATASDQIQRTGSPQTATPTIQRPPSVSTPPVRSSSVVPISSGTSGFEDDAWTNRPSSTKPVTTAPRTPSAPPTTAGNSGNTSTTPPPPPPPPPAPPAPPAHPLNIPAAGVATTPASHSLAKTTESDVFDQLARLSELRKTSTPLSPQHASTASPTVATPPAGGMGVGPSPVPMGQILTQPTGIIPQPSPQPIQQLPYNGPRGPFAPVPANQGMLQPLIPTQTGFNSFVPTRPNNSVSPFASQLSPPSFLSSQPTGLPSSGSLMSQPTGFGPGAFSGFQHPGNNFSQVQTNANDFNSTMNQSPFGAGSFSAIPGPPLATSSSNLNSANPANVFAQMKSGTFAMENNGSTSQSSDNYDALRPNTLAPQMTGWTQSYNYNYAGYQH